MLSPRKPCMPSGSHPVDEVRLSASVSSGEVGQTSTFVAQAYAKGKKVTGQIYSISSNSDPSKATATIIGSTGTISRLAVGTTRVTVRVGSVNSLPLTITVTTPIPASLRLTPDVASVLVGANLSLIYSATSAFGIVIPSPSVTGEVEDTTKITIGSISGGSAQISGIAAGTTRIRVKSGSIISNWSTVVVTAVITGSGGGSTDAVGPRTLINSARLATPSTVGTVINVADGDDIQAAFDTATNGDIIKVALSAIFDKNCVIPEKIGATPGQYITVQLDGALPVEGTRISPTVAAMMNFPRIRSLGTDSAIKANPRAVRWRFIGIEITTAPSVTNNTNGLVALGSGEETSLADIATGFVFDCCYIHGNADLDCKRGITNNAASVAVVDSWISEIHSHDDSNGIGGWNGPGPYKYVNNTVECAGVSIGSGGAHVYLPGNIPSDFEIRRNHLTKNLAWKGTWVMKNNLEFKNAQFALVEGNVCDNCPADAQSGFSMILWSADQDGLAPWSTCNNITVRYNVIKNCTAGFQLSAHGFRLTETQPMHHITIRHNVHIGIDGPAQAGIGQSYGQTYVMTDAIAQLTIEHNTGFSPSSSTYHWGGAKPLQDLIIRNNLGGGGQYQMFNGSQGATAWNEEAGPGSIFGGNVVAEMTAAAPPSNYTPTIAQVKLAGGESKATDPTATLADLTLAGDSPYKGTATDGTDPGADMVLVAAAVAGVGGGF